MGYYIHLGTGSLAHDVLVNDAQRGDQVACKACVALVVPAIGHKQHLSGSEVHSLLIQSAGEHAGPYALQATVVSLYCFGMQSDADFVLMPSTWIYGGLVLL